MATKTASDEVANGERPPGRIDPTDLRRQLQEQQIAAARAYVQAYRALSEEHGMELVSRVVLSEDGRLGSVIDRVRLDDGTVLRLG